MWINENYSLFSIYGYVYILRIEYFFDAAFTDISELRVFFDHLNSYQNENYLILWSFIILISIVFYLLERPKPPPKISGELNTGLLLTLCFLNIALSALLISSVTTSATSRANALLLLNDRLPWLAILVTFVVWFNSFGLLLAKGRAFFILFSLSLIIPLVLVDRSYLIMLIFAVLIRQEQVSMTLLLIGGIAFICMMVFWKIILGFFWYGLDVAASLPNIKLGLARYEAVTSQSIQFNCFEFGKCIDQTPFEFLERFVSKQLPAPIDPIEQITVQQIYLMEYFPDVFEKGGGLGYSAPLEFWTTFGPTSGLVLLALFIGLLLLVANLVNNKFVYFIVTMYCFRFHRLDVASGVKGIIVFGSLALFIFLILAFFLQKTDRKEIEI